MFPQKKGSSPNVDVLLKENEDLRNVVNNGLSLFLSLKPKERKDGTTVLTKLVKHLNTHPATMMKWRAFAEKGLLKEIDTLVQKQEK